MDSQIEDATENSTKKRAGEMRHYLHQWIKSKKDDISVRRQTIQIPKKTTKKLQVGENERGLNFENEKRV